MNKPATDDRVLVVKATGFAHGLDNVEYRKATATAEVVRLVTCIVRAVIEDLALRSERIESDKVTFGKIHDVQVVAHASAVGCRVVIAEDLQLGVLDTSACHLSKQWQEVSWTSARILSDETRWVRTSRAEWRMSK